jgi:hypothetical protein
VIPPAQQQQIAQTMEDDAEVMRNTDLEKLLVAEPKDVQVAILEINEDATNRALQFALLIPILAGLAGLFASFRMIRLEDIEPSAYAEASLV